MKRPADDDEQDGASGSSAKRILPEDQVRPPLSRGDSLPAVPFVPERPPNFKDKHPIRAPSFDTATFKAGSELNFFVFNYLFYSFNCGKTKIVHPIDTTQIDHNYVTKLIG